MSGYVIHPALMPPYNSNQQYTGDPGTFYYELTKNSVPQTEFGRWQTFEEADWVAQAYRCGLDQIDENDYGTHAMIF